MIRSLVVVVLCCTAACAHVVKFHGDQDHVSIDHVDPNAKLTLPAEETKPHLRGAVADDWATGLILLPAKSKGHCVYMLMALCFLCCGGGLMKSAVGEGATSVIMTVLSTGMFFYLLYSGIYSAYWNGEHVGIPCKIMCWWAILQMVCFAIASCLFCLVFGAAIAVKNIVIKKMQTEYEAMMKEISGPRRDYYESKLFKEKCERLFQKADADASGNLDMKELQAILVEITGNQAIAEKAPLLQEAFEQHGDSEVSQHEFVEMMKFVSVVSLKEGSMTVQQAFEILQLPETASKSEVTKSYHKMALKYHPDKRSDVSPDVARRDMGQVNDAHAKVQEHLKEAN